MGWSDDEAAALASLALLSPANPPDIMRDIWSAACLTEPGFPTSSAALELHQRSSGFDPVVSAADMRLLALHSQQEAAQRLLKRQPEAPEAQQLRAAAQSSNRELLQLDPSAAAFLHWMRGSAMTLVRGPEAVAAYLVSVA